MEALHSITVVDVVEAEEQKNGELALHVPVVEEKRIRVILVRVVITVQVATEQAK